LGDPRSRQAADIEIDIWALAEKGASSALIRPPVDCGYLMNVARISNRKEGRS
jgi:hypothetical protein